MPPVMNAAELKELYDRKARAMARRPAFGRGSGHACARLVGKGLTCEVDLENRAVRVDQPAGEGGTGSAAHPGQLMRASLAACLAMGYGILGGPAGGTARRRGGCADGRLRCARAGGGGGGGSGGVATPSMDVVVTTAAPEADVRRVVETADRLSPMLANIDARVERSLSAHHREAARSGSRSWIVGCSGRSSATGGMRPQAPTRRGGFPYSSG